MSFERNGMYFERNGSFIDTPRGSALVYCTDATFEKGISQELDYVYNMKEKLWDYYSDDLVEPGTALLVEDVFNLIVKSPNDSSTDIANVKSCLRELKAMMFEFHIKKIMVSMRSFEEFGISRLEIHDLFKEAFGDSDANIIFCVR